MGMTPHDFETFAKLITDLWPRWGYVDPKCPEKSNWNTTKRANIYYLLKSYELADVCKAARKQSMFDPDSAKPSFTSMVNDLRATVSIRGRDPEEEAIWARALEHTKRMREWGFANRHRLDEIEREAVKARPRLKLALAYARKFHGDARVWVCEQWDKGYRFEDFATSDDPEPVHEPIEVVDSQTDSEIPF